MIRIIPILVLLCCTIIVASANAATGKQLLIGSNINSIDAFGKYNDTEYTDRYYPVTNLFDNKTGSWFWSQFGKSGFVISLDPLDKPVCSVEIDVRNPKNTPFNLRLGNPDTFVNFDGNLDKPKEILEINNCIKDVKGISMTFTPPNDWEQKNKWTTIYELRLFTNSSVIPPDPEPPICKDGYHWDSVLKKCVPNTTPGGNVTSITISNSTATMNVTDSKLIINIDTGTEIIENHQSDEDDEEEEDEEK